MSENIFSPHPNSGAVIDAFIEKIDLNRESVINKYGISAENKLCEIIEMCKVAIAPQKNSAAHELKTELIPAMSELSRQIEGRDNGLRSLFSSPRKRHDKVAQSYSELAVELASLCTALQVEKSGGSSFGEILSSLKQLSEELLIYLSAGRKKVENACNFDLTLLNERAKATLAENDIKKREELEHRISAFEARLFGIERTIAFSNEIFSLVESVRLSSQEVERASAYICGDAAREWKALMDDALCVTGQGEPNGVAACAANEQMISKLEHLRELKNNDCALCADAQISIEKIGGRFRLALGRYQI